MYQPTHTVVKTTHGYEVSLIIICILFIYVLAVEIKVKIKKGKLSLSTPWMRAKRMEIQLYSFFASSLDGVHWSISYPALLCTGNKPRYALSRRLDGLEPIWTFRRRDKIPTKTSRVFLGPTSWRLQIWFWVHHCADNICKLQEQPSSRTALYRRALSRRRAS